MKSMHRLVAAVGLAAMTSVAVAGSGYHYIGVGNATQQHSNWCWAAASVNVLDWYGSNPSQCNVANWALGRSDACGNSVFYWNSYANSTNALFGQAGSVQAILTSSNVGSTAYSSALGWSTIVNDVNAGHPFVMRFGWYDGGGHILVGYGYDDTNGTKYVGYANPWPGEGYTWSTYGWTVSAAYDHAWTHTLRTR